MLSELPELGGVGWAGWGEMEWGGMRPVEVAVKVGRQSFLNGEHAGSM